MTKAIKNGLNSAPLVGSRGRFYPHMYVQTQEDWDNALDSAWELGQGCLDFCDHDNTGEMGETPIVKQGGYEYLYYVDARGDYCAVAFREEVCH